MIFELKGQTLKIEDSIIAEGALNFVTFRVKCDKAWKKRNITVRFFHTGTEESADLPDIKESKSYYFPESLLKEGVVEIGVIGIDSKGEVITTEKKEIAIKGSVSGGETPKISKDAYAEYVNDVLYHRKKCEKAEKTALEAMKKCQKAEKSMEQMHSACQKSEKLCREILENVSGALDAIGISIRDVKNAETNLLFAESELRTGEEKRESGERLRRIEEREREKGELSRKESEIERDLSEKGRVSSEKARAISETLRNEKLRDFDIRLTKLEERKNLFPYCTEKISFDTSYSAESFQRLKGIRIFGKSTICDNLIKSVAEDGYFNIKLDGREEKLELKKPLHGIGDIFDELVLEKDEAYVIRRTVEITFGGDEDILEEGTENGKNTFIFSLPYDVLVSDETSGICSLFSFGKEISVSGNHVCLLLSKEEYPTKSKLSEKLHNVKTEGKPFSIILPLANEKRENVFTVNLPDLIKQTEVSEACLGVLCIERNLLEILEKLKQNIEEMKKEK